MPQWLISTRHLNTPESLLVCRSLCQMYRDFFFFFKQKKTSVHRKSTGCVNDLSLWLPYFCSHTMWALRPPRHLSWQPPYAAAWALEALWLCTVSIYADLSYLCCGTSCLQWKSCFFLAIWASEPLSFSVWYMIIKLPSCYATQRLKFMVCNWLSSKIKTNPRLLCYLMVFIVQDVGISLICYVIHFFNR